MKELVSIIVPVYNAEHYLDTLLGSIQQQTYPSFEVITIDDGSTDRSVNILEKWMKRDNRFKLWRQSNQGQAKARAFGISKAQGEYIGFADSDDFVSSDWIATLVQGLDKGADIAVSGYDHYDEQKDSYFASAHPVQNHDNKQPEIMLEWLLNEQMEGYLWNKLFRRELFDNIDLTPNFNFMEDVYIIGQMIPTVKQVNFLDNITYHYRENHDSTTRTYLDTSAVYSYQALMDQLTILNRKFSSVSGLQRNINIRRIKVTVSLFDHISLHDEKLYADIGEDFVNFLRHEAGSETLNHFSLYTRFFLKLIKIFSNPVKILRLRLCFVHFRNKFQK